MTLGAAGCVIACAPQPQLSDQDEDHSDGWREPLSVHVHRHCVHAHCRRCGGCGPARAARTPAHRSRSSPPSSMRPPSAIGRTCCSPLGVAMLLVSTQVTFSIRLRFLPPPCFRLPDAAVTRLNDSQPRSRTWDSFGTRLRFPVDGQRCGRIPSRTHERQALDPSDRDSRLDLAARGGH